MTDVEGLTPLTLRTHALATLGTVEERTARVFTELEAESESSGLRLLATLLELRDIAREEQRWVDAVFREHVLDDQAMRTLQGYKIIFAGIEYCTSGAAAWGDTDRGNAEAGRSGELTAQLLELRPDLEALPDE